MRDSLCSKDDSTASLLPPPFTCRVQYVSCQYILVYCGFEQVRPGTNDTPGEEQERVGVRLYYRYYWRHPSEKISEDLP